MKKDFRFHESLLFLCSFPNGQIQAAGLLPDPDDAGVVHTLPISGKCGIAAGFDAGDPHSLDADNALLAGRPGDGGIFRAVAVGTQDPQIEPLPHPDGHISLGFGTG